MRRSFLQLVLLISLLTSLYAVNAFASETPSPEQFSDLPTGWSRDAVINAVNNGLLYGVDGKILPKEYLTRAQLAAIINRAFGTTYAADLSLYTDVSAQAWYYEDLSFSVGNQTLVGYKNKLFPNNTATREEVFTVLARVIKPDSPTNLSALQAFSDFDQISSWAAYDLAAMVESGYMHAANGTLQPKTRITREEFAYVIDQFSDMYISSPQDYAEPDASPPPDSEYNAEPPKLEDTKASDVGNITETPEPGDISGHIYSNRAQYMDRFTPAGDRANTIANISGREARPDITTLPEIPAKSTQNSDMINSGYFEPLSGSESLVND